MAETRPRRRRCTPSSPGGRAVGLPAEHASRCPRARSRRLQLARLARRSPAERQSVSVAAGGETRPPATLEIAPETGRGAENRSAREGRAAAVGPWSMTPARRTARSSSARQRGGRSHCRRRRQREIALSGGAGSAGASRSAASQVGRAAPPRSASSSTAGAAGGRRPARSASGALEMAAVAAALAAARGLPSDARSFAPGETLWPGFVRHGGAARRPSTRRGAAKRIGESPGGAGGSRRRPSQEPADQLAMSSLGRERLGPIVASAPSSKSSRALPLRAPGRYPAILRRHAAVAGAAARSRPAADFTDRRARQRPVRHRQSPGGLRAADLETRSPPSQAKCRSSTFALRQPELQRRHDVRLVVERSGRAGVVAHGHLR